MPAHFRLAPNWARLLVLVWVFLAACVAGTGQSQLKPISPEAPFTIIVLGDNRGESSDEQHPVFHQMVRAINDYDGNNGQCDRPFKPCIRASEPLNRTETWRAYFY